MKDAEQLYDALKQLVDYVIDGCPEGSYIAVIEAKAVLANIKAVPAAAIEPPKLTRRDDWHYDSQGYCDNPGRGY